MVQILDIQALKGLIDISMIVCKNSISLYINSNDLINFTLLQWFHGIGNDKEKHHYQKYLILVGYKI